MNDVSLLEMLNAREMRATTQLHIIRQYQKPLICLTLNIPGPVKVFDSIPETFYIGCTRIEALLAKHEISVLKEIIVKEHTGYEAFYCVDSEPDTIKNLMILLEDQDEIGRIFDIDVLRRDGRKVSREDMGYPARQCLLCQETAHNCSRSRRHSVDELLSKIKTVLSAHSQKG